MKRKFIVILLSLSFLGVKGQDAKQPDNTVGEKINDLSDRVDALGSLGPGEIYELILAADVPDNNRPERVYFKKEPGHVFIILQKRDTVLGELTAIVWGFYPVRPVSSLAFRNVRCELRDNSNREYDASITRRIDSCEMKNILSKIKALSTRKYNINKYNCYDYAIDLFNSVPGAHPLKFIQVRFPFIFGKGGSPCGLYAQLKELQKNPSPWANHISIQPSRAPGKRVSVMSNTARHHTIPKE